MSDPQEYLNSRPVARDASSYVRNCLDPTLLGMHPAWIAFVFAGVFLTAWPLRLICALGIAYIAYSAKQNTSLFDTARRLRRKLVGMLRKPFRSN